MCCRQTVAPAPPPSPVHLWPRKMRSTTLLASGKLTETPIVGHVAAISVGIVQGTPLLDLEYTEDFGCDTDMNVVMTGAGHFVEVQGTAEGAAFTRDEMNALLALAEKGIGELVVQQREALQKVNTL
jgi:ribonuclease PH